jgi:RNA polymerase sigma-70 factor (ECF subfamily)
MRRAGRQRELSSFAETTLAVTAHDRSPGPRSARDAGYEEAVDRFGHALDRLARAYEADPDKRRDLIQEIHFAIWRSFDGYDRRCSLRTWVYRVAHNTATTHVTRAFRLRRRQFITLDELEAEPESSEAPADEALDRRRVLARLFEVIQRLDPLDRQVIVSYLDGLEAAEIAEIVGLSRGAVGMKVHRIKRVLARHFKKGAAHVR